MSDEQIEQLTREVWVAEQRAAADTILRLTLENERLRQVLTQILDLYPYLHCVCGRVKDRIKDDMRVEARKLLADDPLTRGRLTAKIGHDRTAEK